MTRLRTAAALLGAAFPALAAAQTFTEQGTTVLGNVVLNAISVSYADIDNDGDPDVLFQGSSSSPVSRKLYRNNFVPDGTLTFTDITATHGPVASDTQGWSAAWGDYDSDGDVDVFLGEANTASPTTAGDLFRNDGAAGFTNVSATTINDPGFHQNVAWCDIDNDLDLDLIIGMEGPEKHEIYIHNADGSFTAKGAETGFQEYYGYKAYGMAIGDADADGDMDVYISTCKPGNDIPNNYYRNDLIPGGALHFTDVAATNGTRKENLFFTDTALRYDFNAYGAEFVDMDDDLDLDLFMVGADQQPSKIFRNDGAGMFTDIDRVTNRPLLSTTGGDLNGGHAIDYDNDGDLDLYFHDHLRTTASSTTNASNVARLLYRNDGDWAFTDVTTAEGLGDVTQGGYDSSFADLDLDGDLDMVFPNANSSRERVFLSSASTNGNHWLMVRLKGRAPNTTAIGAQIYVTVRKGTPQEKTWRRDANTNASTFAQSDLPVHFGLGSATVVDEIRVVWPDRTEQIITSEGAAAGIAADQYKTIVIPEGDRWTIR